ncbi:MAG: bifunctional GNAT family N-acetyltransferase/(deoxy)nucleoside triphosphate pyrophosphohydrolase [Rhodospirillaceae bacterium]
MSTFPPFTDALDGEEGCLGVYPLRGDRILLRPLDERHLQAIAPLADDAEVSRHTARLPYPYTADHAAAFVAESRALAEQGLSLTLAIERRGDGRLLGVIGLERDRDDPALAEVGYWLGRDFWGQGLASEALRTVLAHAVDDLGFTRFVAGVAVGNPASRRVLEKVGFGDPQPGSCTAPARTGGVLDATFVHMTAEGFRAASARSILLVTAVALVDPDNRVLLQKRPEGKTLAGLWEFPGGKVDPFESPERALIRELREELGIDVRESCLAPITFASHAAAGFHLLMPLYLCRQWKGRVDPREGQQIAWVAPNRLSTYPMPPADIPLIPILRDWLG